MISDPVFLHQCVDICSCAFLMSTKGLLFSQSLLLGHRQEKRRKTKKFFPWEVLSFYSGRELFLEDLFICLTVIESLGYLCKYGQENWVLIFPDTKSKIGEKNGWMASLTRWTWVSVNSRSWWWTGRPGVLRFMGSQRVGHDWATDLIWSDLIGHYSKNYQ